FGGVCASRGSTDALAAGPREHFFGQTRLSDTWFARQNDKRGCARPSIWPGSLKRLPFRPPPDERQRVGSLRGCRHPSDVSTARTTHRRTAAGQQPCPIEIVESQGVGQATQARRVGQTPFAAFQVGDAAAAKASRLSQFLLGQ